MGEGSVLEHVGPILKRTRNETTTGTSSRILKWPKQP